MDLQTSIKTCFNKYAIFSGRASRSEFWWFFLFGILGGIIAAIIDVMIFGYSIEVTGPIGWIFTIVIFLPSFAVGARRCMILIKLDGGNYCGLLLLVE